MRGPTTPARAWPLVTPNVPMATAIASSKLLPVAVNATVDVFAYPRPRAPPSANDPVNIRPK